MTRFANQREAKEFVVRSILSQAEKSNIFFSDTERRMLYFSETDPTLSDMTDTVRQFDQEYDSAAYEKKVRGVVSDLGKRMHSEGKEWLRSWSDALRTLSEGDHYVLVMIPPTPSSRRSAADILRLIVVALTITLILVGIAILLDRAGVQLTHEAAAFYAWAVAVSVISAFLLLGVVMGKGRATDLADRLMSKIFGDSRAKR